MSDMLRISGLVSGMDTDSTVKQLIQTEQNRVDKAKQEKQFLEWQSEDYRGISNSLRGFQDEYFDILKPETNMRSAATYNMFSGTVTVGGLASTSLSVSTSSSSIKGSFTINSVAQLATRDIYTSGAEVLGNLKTGVMGAIGDIENQIANTDNTLTFIFDGVRKEIALDKTGYSGDYQNFADDLTTKLQAAYTNVDITAEVVGGNQIEFKIYESGSVITEENGHTFSIENDNADLLTLMNITAGQSNTVNISKTLAEVFNVSGDQSMTLNGVSFTFTDDKKISDVMNEINSSSAGVTISYDTFSDTFTMESSSYGTDAVIAITDTSLLLEKFNLQGVNMTNTGPQNAEFVVNGVATTRSSNTFVVNGTTITLNEIPTGPVTVDVEADSTDVKDMIVKFINKYNEIITELNDKTAIRRERDYPPLTDAQKENMSEDQITSWEKEARKGTLYGDSTLESITDSLRNALYQSVSGLGITLYDIGITTSANYKDQGKLIINEEKLDKALADRPNEVIQLFSKESDTDYTDSINRLTRNSENGIVNRIYDILQDNIRLTRDSSGSKGYLIEKAGFSSTDNANSDFTKKITEMDEKIDNLLELLQAAEEKYYEKFAAMESAMSQLTSQGEWLASQLGGN